MRESRVRTFWVICTIDSYVSTMCGLPRVIKDEDIDQALPSDVDDDYILRDKILEMPDNKLSRVSGLIAYVKLLPILSNIVRHIYPVRFEGSIGDESQSYLVSHSKVCEIEGCLRQWNNNLRHGLRPGDSAPSRMAKRLV